MFLPPEPISSFTPESPPNSLLRALAYPSPLCTPLLSFSTTLGGFPSRPEGSQETNYILKDSVWQRGDTGATLKGVSHQEPPVGPAHLTLLWSVLPHPASPAVFPAAAPGRCLPPHLAFQGRPGSLQAVVLAVPLPTPGLQRLIDIEFCGLEAGSLFLLFPWGWTSVIQAAQFKSVPK